jgi:peptidylprolyl isomerase
MNKIVILIIIIAIAAFFYFRSNTNNKEAVENKQIGAEYLASNKNKAGVIETKSGLQYLVLNPGKATQHPAARDTVKVHYHGTLIDGRVFDSSVDRGQPISFALNRVIPGWTEGVQLMVIGEKTRFFIPANLAYGNRSTGIITPGSVLIFDVELLGINE